jgi:O-antigen/teichoic acid export membrane protein
LSLPLDALRQGGWMLAATVVTGILNYLSNVLAGRVLGPADYSIFASLLSLSTVLVVAAGVVQTVVTNYVARLRGRGAAGQAGVLLIHVLKRLLPWGVAGALALALLAKPLSALLQISSPLPVIAISLFSVPAALLPPVNGALRGLQRFGALGGTQISVAVFRLLATAGLIGLGLGAAGAVASLPLSGLGALALGLCFLRDVIRWRREGAAPEMEGLFAYSFHAALAVACFAVLTNGDVFIVRSRFSPTEAGLYAAVATLGKTTFWLSGAVVMLLFPKAAERHARGQPTRGILRTSLLAVLGLCGSVTAVFFLFPSPIVRIFFGEQYLARASLLGPYGLAMTFYALVNVWLFYYLAVQERRYGYVLLAGVVLQGLLLALLPLDLTVVVGALLGLGVCLSLVGMWGIRTCESALVEGER